MRSAAREIELQMCMWQTRIGSNRAAVNTIISVLPEALLMLDTTSGALWSAILGISIRRCLNQFSFCTRYSTQSRRHFRSHRGLNLPLSLDTKGYFT